MSRKPTKADLEQQISGLREVIAKQETQIDQLNQQAQQHAKTLTNQSTTAQQELNKQAQQHTQALTDHGATTQQELTSQAQKHTQALTDHGASTQQELTAQAQQQTKSLTDLGVNTQKEIKQEAQNQKQTLTDLHSEHLSKLSSTADEGAEKVSSEIQRFEQLREDFENLTIDNFTAKSSKLIASDYKNNADRHQSRETWFQIICAAAIALAIIVLMLWLWGVFGESYAGDDNLHWLPVATITSLFLFLARWAARVAYRHGLEARRLNQYALDLTAMPAFFAQDLLNQGDQAFQSDGKKIIQAKSAKMFGNIERFDEQQTHSPMELLWKWLTNRFETERNSDIDFSNSDSSGSDTAESETKSEQSQTSKIKNTSKQSSAKSN